MSAVAPTAAEKRTSFHVGFVPIATDALQQKASLLSIVVTWIAAIKKLNTCPKPRHHDDNGDLHRALSCDRIEIPSHPGTDLREIRVGLLQLKANKHVDGGQKSQAQYRHQRDKHQGRSYP